MRDLPFKPGPMQHVCTVLEEAWRKSVGSHGECWEFFIVHLPIVCSLVSLVCDVPDRPQKVALVLLVPGEDSAV